MRVPCILSLALLLVGTVACSDSQEPVEDPAQLRAALASGSPAITAWASTLLEGTGIAIDPLYAPGGHAGSATPPRERLRAARDATRVVLQGAGFAKWARQAALPSSRTVRLIEKGDDGVLMVEERTHAHGAQGEHTHRGADGHTWLAPTLAAQQIGVLGNELAAAFPEYRDQVLERARALAQDQLAGLGALRSALGETAPPQGLGMHGHGYGYLAAAWGGAYAEVDFALDQRLGTSDWNRLRAQLGSDGAVLLLPTAPTAELEQQLRDELRVICVVIEGGAQADEPAAWLAAREQGIAAIAASFAALFELRE